jgi:hypothetical protein
MTTPDSARQHLDVLAGVTRALENGNWRTAALELSHGGHADGRRELVALMVALRCVARSMRFQSAHADVEAAQNQLATAARVLVGRERLPRLGRQPAGTRRLAHLAWTVMRLIHREQEDLDAIRLIFVDLRRGRPEVINAGVEHLTWVEFDPWTVQVHPQDRALLGLDDDAYRRFRTGNRHDMCVRATRLRQFADARHGSVNEKDWQRMGGYPHVREAALRVLAGEPLTRGRADLPVRLGRRRAWEYACRWAEDASA